MTLTFAAALESAGIDPAEALVIRHAYVREHEDGTVGIHGDSSNDEIMTYTSGQSANSRIFPATPPKFWVVFLHEGGDRARLWSVVTNRGQVGNGHDGLGRTFDLEHTDLMADLRNRLVIGWRSPRTWWIKAATAAAYPVMEIADSQPRRFSGFDALTLDYSTLQAVLREHRYAAWRTALSSVICIYLGCACSGAALRPPVRRCHRTGPARPVRGRLLRAPRRRDRPPEEVSRQGLWPPRPQSSGYRHPLSRA